MRKAHVLTENGFIPHNALHPKRKKTSKHKRRIVKESRRKNRKR